MVQVEIEGTFRRGVPRAPLVPAAVAMAAGVVLGRYASLPIGAWAAAAIAAFLTAAITLRRRHLRGLTSAAIAAAILFGSAAACALAYHRIPADHIVTYSDRGSVLATIRGRIVSTPRLRQPQTPYWQPARTSFLLAAEAVRGANGDWLATRGLVRVTVAEPLDDAADGAQVELIGSLRRIRSPGNPGQYDWRAAERYRGVLVRFFVPAGGGVRTLAGASENPFRRLWRRARLATRQHLGRSGRDEDLLIEALVLGERDPALRRLNQVMVEAGIAHFLSISGLHLGIFLGFIYWVCRVLTLRPRRSAWVVLIVLAGYVLLAEPRAPLLRAAIMASAFCVAAISGRSVSTANALAGAAVVLLVIDPLQMFRPGFQLSFGIVCGIVALHEPIRRLLFGRWLRRRGLMVFRSDERVRRWLYHRGTDWLMSLIGLSLAAYVSAAPLVAYHFGRFCPYAPLLSILLLPVMVAVLIPAYVSTALVLLTPNLAAAIGELAAGAAGVMSRLVMLLKHLPGLSIDLYAVPAWCVALAYSAAALWVLARRSRPTGQHARSSPRGRLVLSAAVVATIGFLAAIAVTQRPARPPPAGRLHVLDVAHGTTTLLHAPDGKTYLFDAGTLSAANAYEQVLRPFLRAMRLPSPEAVFVSHANIDHYNALPNLLARTPLGPLGGPPRRAYINDFFGRREEDPPAVRELMAAFQRRNVRVIRLRAGQTVSLTGGVSVEVLWPPGRGGTVKSKRSGNLAVAKAATRPSRGEVMRPRPGLTVPPAEAIELDVNNSSLVLRVVCGARSILIPGDIGEIAERRLTNLPPERIRCDALILPHHGSATPTLKAFIEAVRPAVLVQSSSYRPAPSELLDAIGERERYATFRDGWISLTVGTEKITIETMGKD